MSGPGQHLWAAKATLCLLWPALVLSYNYLSLLAKIATTLRQAARVGEEGGPGLQTERKLQLRNPSWELSGEEGSSPLACGQGQQVARVMALLGVWVVSPGSPAPALLVHG